MLAAPAQVSAAGVHLCCGVRGLQQGRGSGARTVLGFGGPQAFLRSASTRPPPQRAAIDHLAASGGVEDVHILGPSRDSLGSMADTTGHLTQPPSTALCCPEIFL